MNNEHKQQLLESAHALISALEADNDTQIEAQLSLLTQGRDDNLFIEVGKLTRELHASLNNFNIDSNINIDFPDTRDRLNYIVDITEEAAHKTLEIIDNAMPTVELVQKEAEKQLPEISAQLTSIQSAFSEITLAQGFQDLTGQVIRQVTDLIGEVETNLVHLIKVASEHNPDLQINVNKKQSDPVKAEGPQINKNKPNVVADQDDVDDLLSSLGF